MISWITNILWQFFIIACIYRFIKCLGPTVRYLRCRYLYPLMGWTPKYELYANKWTVITGCTDGIGRSYTKQLARKGFCKFLLIGRNPSKLEDVVKELKEIRSDVQTECHIFDFAEDEYDKLPVNQLKTYDIGLLVNCVGIVVDELKPFHEQPEGNSVKMMRVNALSAVKMTELVLPNMAKADHGIIVYIGSLQGWRPIPYLGCYPASKAAMSFFSESLSQEYKYTNVKIQCLFPLLVATKLSRYHGQADGYLVIDPDAWVVDAVANLGMVHSDCGCLQHNIQASILLFPPFFCTAILLQPFYKYVIKPRFAKYHEEKKAVKKVE